MLCPSCGSNLEDNVFKCPNCGHIIKQDWKTGLYTTKINYDEGKIVSRRAKRKADSEQIPTAVETDNIVSATVSNETPNLPETDAPEIATAESDITENTTLPTEPSVVDRTFTVDVDNKSKLSGFKKGLIITIASILILGGLTVFGYYSNKLVLSNYKSWDDKINIFLGLK